MYIISLRRMSWGHSQDSILYFFFPPIIADLISAQVHTQEDDRKLALSVQVPVNDSPLETVKNVMGLLEHMGIST